MAHLFSMEIQKGKHRGILSIYILHSLKKQPKTGYKLIAEIEEKTEGTWIPSKGTIYPLLKQLEKENLIKVKDIGLRSKKIFMITDEGKKVLSTVKKHGKEFEENFLKFKKLFVEIGKFENIDITEHLIHIRMLSISKYKKTPNKVKQILQQCENKLKNI